MGLVSPCSRRSPRPCIMMAIFNISDFIILQVAPPSLAYLPVLKRFLELQECCLACLSFPYFTTSLKILWFFLKSVRPWAKPADGNFCASESMMLCHLRDQLGALCGQEPCSREARTLQTLTSRALVSGAPLSPSTSPPSLLGRLF